MSILLNMHSWLRWVLGLVLLILLLRTAWLARRYTILPPGERRWLAAFSGLMDTQVLLGLLYFFLSGLNGTGFPRYRLEHLTMMLLAAGLAHLPAAWAKRQKPNSARKTPFVLLAVLFAIYLGVAVLPGGRWLP